MVNLLQIKTWSKWCLKCYTTNQKPPSWNQYANFWSTEKGSKLFREKKYFFISCFCINTLKKQQSIYNLLLSLIYSESVAIKFPFDLNISVRKYECLSRYFNLLYPSREYTIRSSVKIHREDIYTLDTYKIIYSLCILINMVYVTKRINQTFMYINVWSKYGLNYEMVYILLLTL